MSIPECEVADGPIFDENTHDDFLEQMFSSSSPWTELSSEDLDHNNSWSFNPSSQEIGFGSVSRDNQDGSGSNALAHEPPFLRQHEIDVSSSSISLDQQFLLSNCIGESGFYDDRVSPPFSLLDPFTGGGDGSMQAMYNGFVGSLTNPPPVFDQSNHAGIAVRAQSVDGTITQPKQRVRARRGQATDPHSIAERLRRERIAERTRALQELVPNANKTDKASMLDEIIDYVKFLQLQVKVLSMSRLGGIPPAPESDFSPEGGITTPSSGDAMSMTEHQVAKLMEEDMGSAMQYLQGKGLCLMPISLATAISHATCHIPTNGPHATSTCQNRIPAISSNAPASPNISVLTIQSTPWNNGAIKDPSSAPKP